MFSKCVNFPEVLAPVTPKCVIFNKLSTQKCFFAKKLLSLGPLTPRVASLVDMLQMDSNCDHNQKLENDDLRILRKSFADFTITFRRIFAHKFNKLQNIRGFTIFHGAKSSEIFWNFKH